MKIPPTLLSLLVGMGGVLMPLGANAAEPAPVAEPTAEQAAFFEREIRPVLIKACVDCHGAKKQEAGLALDSRAGLMKGSDEGPVIHVGKPEQSSLIRAVRRTGDVQMPPDSKLADHEVAALSKWVEMGSPWPGTIEKSTNKPAKPLWSLEPVKRIEPPAASDPAWNENGIDRLLFAKLKEQGLSPVGPADKRTLLRRVTLDLTGLPPTTEEIAAFLADDTPQAYAKLIDRLLASPRYGERWARHWLDVARYADTAGDGADYPVREAGKYRDWVIRAFNADQPYDQFVRDQIAGDILARTAPPEQYADKVTATGYLAVGKRYGYNATPDFQHLDFADAIDSVGRGLLGLSLGCARCHDHKFDPVSMSDYYAMYGIFQSTRWAFPGGEELKRPTHFPALVPAEEAARRDAAKAAELAGIDAEIQRLKKEQTALDGKSFAGGVDLGLEGQAPGKPPASPWLSIGPNAIHAEAQSPFTHTHPAGTRGVRMGTGKPNEGVRYVFASPLRKTPEKLMHFTIDFCTKAGGNQPGSYRFYLGRGVIESLAFECSVSESEIALRSGGDAWQVLRKLTPGNWYTLAVAIDPEKKTLAGLVGAPGDLVRFQDKPLNAGWDGVADTFICDAIGHVAGAAPERDLDNIGLQDSPFAEPGSPPVVAPVATAEQKERLAKVEAELATVTKLRAAKAAVVPYEVGYGVSEGTPVNARIQKRGEPEKLGSEVPRKFLDALGGDALPSDAKGSGRLELAHWITRPTNPLTARVFVNRVWHWHFGRGLVPTPSDFGVRGELPSHPELLDWVTTQFIESGWSIKSLHRQMLLTRAYQLSSEDQPAGLAADPSNRWLWRYSRRPLDAETIRDAMLAVSGRLDLSPAPVHPFPPVESWGFTIHNPFHAVYDSDRRSIYLMVQRNRRHPFLALFDAADPNFSAAERLPTTTPTQTLFLMNSPFVHAQSEGFARRLLAVQGDDAARMKVALEMALGRSSTEAEVAQAQTFVEAYRQKLAARGTPAAEQPVLAWGALARVMLTSNAFLYID